MLFNFKRTLLTTTWKWNTMSTATISPALNQPRHLIRLTQDVAKNTRIIKAAFLSLCLLTIVAISATDIWFAVENTFIMKEEKNPICLALMKLEPNGYSFFIFGKSFGTLMVILTLTTMNQRNYRYAMVITIAVTCFQLALLTYLTLSDPLMHDLPNFGLLFSDSSESVWQINSSKLSNNANL